MHSFSCISRLIFGKHCKDQGLVIGPDQMGNMQALFIIDKYTFYLLADICT